jgi:hypothetical protein
MRARTMSWAAQAQRPRGPSCALTLLTYCRGRERRHGQGKRAGLNLSVPRADRTRCILRRPARTAFHAKLTVFYVNTYCTPTSNLLHLRQMLALELLSSATRGDPSDLQGRSVHRHRARTPRMGSRASLTRALQWKLRIRRNTLHHRGPLRLH